jgi:large subunit ribosomal protein L10
MNSHIRAWKEKEVTRLVNLAKEYPVIGIANLTGFPASLYGSLKARLSDKAVVTVSRRRVIQRAFEKAGLGEKLNDQITGSTAIVFTKSNPFELYALIKQSKGKVNAKAGQEAPNDIIVPAGDTGLPPGPALSDLKGAGLDVRMEGSSIAVTRDKIVTKKGETITAPVANALIKLGIKPIELRLNLCSVLEEGQLYHSDVLDIDEEEVFNNFVKAEQQAFNLSVNGVIFTEKSTPVLVGKAFTEGKAVAIEANLLTSATVGDVLGKAASAATVVKSLVKDNVPGEEPKAEVETETPKGETEEKKEKPAEKTKEPAKEENKTEEKKE